MNKIVFLSFFVTACTTVNSNQKESQRAVASIPACQNFENLSGEDKQKQFFAYHRRSIFELLQKNDFDDYTLVMTNIMKGGEANTKYIPEFIGGTLQRKEYAAQALLATGKFLSPDINEDLGYRSLKPTFQRGCEFFREEEVKKVHALGTLGIAHMTVYKMLKELGARDEVTGRELPNPWSGVLGPSGNEQGIPLLLRFSIANPVGHTIEIGNQSLSLEFIPGLAIKFLIDHQKSINLVAMDALAGQGADHNFFKYEFSPDFSAHAPLDFNTAQGAEKNEILARYNRNRTNTYVMGLVGKRFFEVIPHVTSLKLADLDAHSNLGPHPFIIDIQQLAMFDKKGKVVEAKSQKRPWRLVFKPALDNIEVLRRSNITDKRPYNPGKIATDFRSKLSYLEPGDRLYYVIGESRTKKRFILGDITLDSSVSPSEFADKIYFIQHQLDTARALNPQSILDPEVKKVE